jgi:hypothetical protein
MVPALWRLRQGYMAKACFKNNNNNNNNTQCKIFLKDSVIKTLINTRLNKGNLFCFVTQPKINVIRLHGPIKEKDYRMLFNLYLTTNYLIGRIFICVTAPWNTLENIALGDAEGTVHNQKDNFNI